MIQHDRLADTLEAAAHHVRQQGNLTWGRTSDWTTAGRMPSTGVNGGGLGEATPDETNGDMREDRAAARYHDELDKLTARLDADLHRLTRIMNICCPPPPKSLQSKDMLAAQVAADGWCLSCWRDDQHLEPISVRPTGQAYYRDRCRPCGQWRNEHGEDPPPDILRARHTGRRIRVKAS